MSSGDEYDDEDAPTIHRRNTFSSARFSATEQQQDSERIVFYSPISINSSKRTAASVEEPTLSSRRGSTTLNCFNDMGHLSRRVFNDVGETGETHLTSDDFENSFGYRKVFDNKLEVTAITATTIATCVSSVLRELMVVGEKKFEQGRHKFNNSKYDIFYG
jgi:hypothetical protein